MMEASRTNLHPGRSTKFSEPEPTIGRTLQNPLTRPKFPLGQIVITPTAAQILSSAEINAALTRHSQGDWGNLDRKDWKENDLSLGIECRILSAYQTQKGEKFWIITEADRSYTTILLPSDY